MEIRVLLEEKHVQKPAIICDKVFLAYEILIRHLLFSEKIRRRDLSAGICSAQQITISSHGPLKKLSFGQNQTKWSPLGFIPPPYPETQSKSSEVSVP